MKVSLHVGQGGPTEGHNDRSMYSDYQKDVEPPRHWDRLGCGSVYDAELATYRELFGETLERQNERAVAMRKRDRVMDMSKYLRKHPPREAIVALGNADEPAGMDDVEALADLFRRRVEDAGGVVISIDVHRERMFDRIEDYEAVRRGDRALDDVPWTAGTAHAHVRYVFPHDGKPDVANCLAAHGVRRPQPDKKRARNNNEAVTWTKDTRGALEDFAENELGRDVDRERMARDVAGLSPDEYARYRRVMRDALGTSNDAAFAYDAALDALSDSKDEAEAARYLSDEAARREREVERREAEVSRREAEVSDAARAAFARVLRFLADRFPELAERFDGVTLSDFDHWQRLDGLAGGSRVNGDRGRRRDLGADLPGS